MQMKWMAPSPLLTAASCSQQAVLISEETAYASPPQHEIPGSPGASPDAVGGNDAQHQGAGRQARAIDDDPIAGAANRLEKTQVE
jgi:hypothetical protein